MKKVVLLIVLSCLFIGCKNNTPANQEQIHSEFDGLLYNQVKIKNDCDWVRIDRIMMSFKPANGSGEYQYFYFDDAALDYGESKVFNLFETPNKYIISQFIFEGQNLNNGNSYGPGSWPNHSVFYDEDEIHLLNNKKILTLTENGKIVASVEYASI